MRQMQDRICEFSCTLPYCFFFISPANNLHSTELYWYRDKWVAESERNRWSVSSRKETGMKLRWRKKESPWRSENGITRRKKKQRNISEHDRKGAISLSGELSLIKTAASTLIAASITPSLWSKVVASSCYLHTHKRTLKTETVLLKPAVYSW